MKAFVAAALLLFAVSAVADEASDARIAELEARIKTLEQQVQRLSALLDAATRSRAASAPTSAQGQAQAQARAQTQVEAPPVVVIQPTQETIRDEIRFQCMQRQTYEHAIGGAAPSFSSC